MANRWATAIPFEISNYDNPESIRFKKYATGTHLVVHGIEVEAGLTPKEVVWQRGKDKLFHYESTREKKYPIPVLLVYAPILRPYILDLVPGNSFVEFLLREGFKVYLLDWGNAGPEDRHLSLEDWILDYMPEAVEGVLTDSTAEGLTLFSRNSENYFDPDSIVQAFGNVPEDFFKRVAETRASSLKPLPDFAGSYV